MTIKNMHNYPDTNNSFYEYIIILWKTRTKRNIPSRNIPCVNSHYRRKCKRHKPLFNFHHFVHFTSSSASLTSRAELFLRAKFIETAINAQTYPWRRFIHLFANFSGKPATLTRTEGHTSGG